MAAKAHKIKRITSKPIKRSEAIKIIKLSTPSNCWIQLGPTQTHKGGARQNKGGARQNKGTNSKQIGTPGVKKNITRPIGPNRRLGFITVTLNKTKPALNDSNRTWDDQG